jgi:hypothetical protein
MMFLRKSSKDNFERLMLGTATISARERSHMAIIAWSTLVGRGLNDVETVEDNDS